MSAPIPEALPASQTSRSSRMAQRLKRLRIPRKSWRPTTVSPKRTLTATLRQWHQRVGLFAALLLCWLAISGILLTRSNQLGFDAARVQWDWLTSLYGLHAEPPRMGFQAGDHWLATTKEAVVLDAAEPTPRLATPLGMVMTGDAAPVLLFIATQDSVVVMQADGTRVDEIRSPVLPVSSIRRIGSVKGEAGTIAIQDYDAYQSSDAGNSWTPVASAAVSWSEPSPLPATEREKIVRFARPSILVEQLLIDLHSGRLFGHTGAWVITVVGFFILWLAGSGTWSWWRIRQSRRRNASR